MLTWWDQYAELPEFIGLPLEDAVELCRRLGYEGPRILVTPTATSVHWTLDARTNRLNVVVRDGRVERAALF